LQVSQVNLQVPQVKQQALANAGPTDAKRPLLHRTEKAMIINTASHQVPLFGGSKPAANGGHLPKTWNSRDTAAKWAVFGASNPPGWIGYWLTVEKTSRNSLGRNSNDVWQR
jgi:hypothetical protein